jgi:hypothetical protein
MLARPLEGRIKALKHRDVFQERNHAENDHDNARDLLGAAIERQHVDQIQNENDDEKCDEYTYEHAKAPSREKRINPALTHEVDPGSRRGTPPNHTAIVG